MKLPDNNDDEIKSIEELLKHLESLMDDGSKTNKIARAGALLASNVPPGINPNCFLENKTAVQIYTIQALIRAEGDKYGSAGKVEVGLAILGELLPLSIAAYSKGITPLTFDTWFGTIIEMFKKQFPHIFNDNPSSPKKDIPLPPSNMKDDDLSSN